MLGIVSVVTDSMLDLAKKTLDEINGATASTVVIDTSKIDSYNETIKNNQNPGGGDTGGGDTGGGDTGGDSNITTEGELKGALYVHAETLKKETINIGMVKQLSIGTKDFIYKNDVNESIYFESFALDTKDLFALKIYSPGACKAKSDCNMRADVTHYASVTSATSNTMLYPVYALTFAQNMQYTTLKDSKQFGKAYELLKPNMYVYEVKWTVTP